MSLRLEAVTFDVVDAADVARFWAGLLDREVHEEPGGAMLPGDQRQLGLRFVTSPTPPTDRPRLHLHVTSNSHESQRRTVEAALRLGGRHIDVGQPTDSEFVVLADPGGNELCVIEPGNGYLAGTGVLGEVTCDGGRDVGLFWQHALGWPLVWDSGEQTAVQSPLGGTKVSWDPWDRATPLARIRNRQRFDVITTDLVGEAERLVSLGANHVTRAADSMELRDPGGNEFTLRASA